MPIPYINRLWTAIRASRGDPSSPTAHDTGLLLLADEGEKLFCPLPETAIPSDELLRSLTTTEFAVYHEIAVRAAGGRFDDDH